MTTPATMGLVVFAKNVAQVAAYYRATLALNTVEDEASHVLLQGRGIELVIHAIPKGIAAQIHITQPPELREETPLKPTFTVASLEAVRVATEATGGWLKPLAKAWQIRGATVLDGGDPEGNVVQFKQFAPPG
jgi:hypothetical protein